MDVVMADVLAVDSALRISGEDELQALFDTESDIEESFGGGGGTGMHNQTKTNITTTTNHRYLGAESGSEDDEISFEFAQHFETTNNRPANPHFKNVSLKQGM